MTRKPKFEPQNIEPKQFSNLAEVERGIQKLKSRIVDLAKMQLKTCIVDLDNVPNQHMHYDNPQVDVVTRAVRNTILEVFGNRSLQWDYFQHFDIWQGDVFQDMPDSYMQQCFEKGIAHAIELLQGEINTLEEKKADFELDAKNPTTLASAITVMPDREQSLKSRAGSCFVICPIGEADSEERKRSDDLLEHIITPVMEEFSYQVIRADKLPNPGKITEQIIEQLMTADLVIADLTGNNANVFYELGVRHTTDKPVIQLIQKGGTVPFDVKVIRTLEYDLQVREAKKATEILKEMVIWLIKNPSKPLIAQPRLPLTATQSGDVRQGFFIKFNDFIRRFSSEWSTEKDSEPSTTEQAKCILSSATYELNHFLSFSNSYLDDGLRNSLHSLVVRIKKLGRHETSLDGGKSFEQFWLIGNAILQDLNDSYLTASKAALTESD